MSGIKDDYSLSRQEQRVIAYSMDGLGDKEVAQEMGISLGTVRTYWKRIAMKIGGHTRAEIVSNFARREPETELRRLRDLATRLQAEIEQRREGEAQYRAIWTCSPVGLFVCDGEAACQDVNPSWEKLTGLRASSVQGRAWMDIVHSDDRNGLLQWWRAHRACVSCEPMEFRLVTPRGNLWVRCSFAPLIIDGRVVGSVGTIDPVEGRPRTVRSSEHRVTAAV